jgi:hypothetical protein
MHWHSSPAPYSFLSPPLPVVTLRSAMLRSKISKRFVPSFLVKSKYKKRQPLVLDKTPVASCALCRAYYTRSFKAQAWATVRSVEQASSLNDSSCPICRWWSSAFSRRAHQLAWCAPPASPWSASIDVRAAISTRCPTRPWQQTCASPSFPSSPSWPSCAQPSPRQSRHRACASSSCHRRRRRRCW